jgi:hypothetical protein
VMTPRDPSGRFVRARSEDLRERCKAGAAIATAALDQEPDVAEALNRLAARILVSRAPIHTTTPDWMPLADIAELESWEMAG